jgi:hypothetical protein
MALRTATKGIISPLPDPGADDPMGSPGQDITGQAKTARVRPSASGLPAWPSILSPASCQHLVVVPTRSRAFRVAERPVLVAVQPRLRVVADLAGAGKARFVLWSSSFSGASARRSSSEPPGDLLDLSFAS